MFCTDSKSSDTAPASLPARERPTPFPREGAIPFFLVVALHGALLGWIVAAPGEMPPKIDPPAIQGILVPPRVTAPERSPSPTSPPRLAPAPAPVKTAVAPKLAVPPKPLEPRPAPVPPPMPESRQAIAVSPAPLAPPQPSAQAEGSPSADPAPAPVPAHAGSPGSSPSSSGGESSSSGEAAPVVSPRVDASHLNNPAPEYPPRSRRLGEEGKVLLDVHILADGSVKEVRVRKSSGFPRLDQAALEAVRRWRYVPARQGGKPIAYGYVQPIVFSLTDRSR